MGARVPPVTTLYWIGESVEYTVMLAVGAAEPTVQLMGSEFEVTVSFGALFVTSKVIGTGRSAYPETLRYTEVEYVPGARPSARFVVENASGAVAVPEVALTVSQEGRLAVLTEKKAPDTLELTLTFAVAGLPEPFTRVNETPGAAGTGVTVRGLGGRIRRVTVTSLSGAGALSRCRVAVLELPAAKLLQPAAAATVNVTGLALAVPPAKELTVSQLGGGFVVLSTVNAVPPAAADVTEIVCAGPGV
jgi:hypothetical protein